MNDTVLSIQCLSVALPEGADRRLAVDDVSLDLRKGETVCIVGESGSGKSITAFSVVGLLSPQLVPVAGKVLFGGNDLLKAPAAEMRRIRGARIAMIFQEPMTALNPVLRCGQQIMEMFEAHGLHTHRARRARAIELLTEVGLPDPAKAFSAFPHELSGGQRQRVMIAMALALEPDVIIADEPTTALDVTTQAQILSLLKRLRENHGTAILFITHDFGVVAEIADRVAVMHRGKVVESGPTVDVLNDPQEAYTRDLLAAVPALTPPAPAGKPDAEIVLSGLNLNKTYRGRSFFNRRDVPALTDVSFDLYRGETLGIVGESGSGKSTLGRCLMRLADLDAGEIIVDGKDLHALSERAFQPMRKTMQMVFQDPFASLNPQRTVGRIIADGPIVHGKAESLALAQAEELLSFVGLDPSSMNRYPREFSGGQRQRIGIARALALEPKIIIADEPVSALDVSVQAQVLKLLRGLKVRLSLSMIFITHDLRVAAQICDRVAVMQRGRIIEMGPTAEIFSNPKSEYTRALLAAIPGQGLGAKQAFESELPA
ncbi:ABC transporter ATP-binding protein [Mesorhizobium microcysteis]|uniref:ABC transporter ATP-binding protein n=1 Tax=Neoaquamicrobium microcysteis TaxID=2682781 RepID=A0A5D4H830_9HYPH|nr:ABC transporter ATP-binding protein [Mesorhizobium microcysteis]MCA0344888.1 ABC transporter ATP-binding protein [Pseudomonadota bacterium]TYR36413.1 ABC transporter ATP-binding protein [Mesorhizobium microcysteis]